MVIDLSDIQVTYSIKFILYFRHKVKHLIIIFLYHINMCSFEYLIN